MPIPCYLAMTGAEFFGISQRPEKLAWMACHFSCYGTGLSNLPPRLPEGSLVIINDRMPPDKHDPQRITDQLRQVQEIQKPVGFLLDFQRQKLPLNAEIANVLVQQLSCPVIVSEAYAEDLDCPVFVSPPPLHIPISKTIHRWTGRKICLEVVPETYAYQVSGDGCNRYCVSQDSLENPYFPDPTLFCSYHISVQEKGVTFTLQRNLSDLQNILNQHEDIYMAVGLYQQLSGLITAH